MKKLMLIVSLLMFLAISSLASTLYAQPVEIINDQVCTGSAADSPLCLSKKNENKKDGSPVDPLTGAESKVLQVANILAWFGGVIAVIMIIYASFVYVTSSGDDGKVKTAKNIILYSVVGLVVIVVSRVIVAFVIDRTLI